MIDLLKNKRSRAAIILGIYFCFFVFLSVISRQDKTSYEVDLNEVVSVDSYDYKIEYNFDDTYIFTGSNSSTGNEIIINNKVYDQDNYDYEINFFNFEYDYLLLYIENSENNILSKSDFLEIYGDFPYSIYDDINIDVNYKNSYIENINFSFITNKGLMSIYIELEF